MDLKLAKEVIACLPEDRTVFDYYQDRYAVMLLEQITGDGVAIADLKATRFGKLLNRPVVRDIVARKGDGVLNRDDLVWIDPGSEVQHYVLTLGIWGDAASYGWCQTSRRGANLVLQLNFSSEHDAPYRRFIDPDGHRPFEYAGHPVCDKGRNTLAWARIDLDLDGDEALIEEVQTDWLRRAEVVARQASRQARDASPETRAAAERLSDYANKTLAVHRRLWSEAMLAAAIWFLTEEIGISWIWYHDFDTGARLKKITCTKPPRSLYTDLPKRFCFERVNAAPALLSEKATRPLKRSLQQGNAHFWHLAV